MSTCFVDRVQAGRELAMHLKRLHLPPPIVVLALPRGGVPVAAEVALALAAPLDLILVRKIGAPWQPELAVAAVAEGDPPDMVVDESVRSATGVDQAYIESQAQIELHEIERRRRAYLKGRPPVDVTGCTAIVVDDGLATGTTMRVALRALRRRHPAKLVMAVPVGPADTVETLRGEVDLAVCLQEPFPFHAVGHHYTEFRQVGDDEVIAALEAARRPAGAVGA